METDSKRFENVERILGLDNASFIAGLKRSEVVVARLSKPTCSDFLAEYEQEML